MINFMQSLKIDNFNINNSSKLFLIAECGVNHNGKFSYAIKMIDEAAKAGFNAIKFQTFIPTLLVHPKTSLAQYQKKTEFKSQQDMLKKYTFSFDQFYKLKKYCIKKKIIFLSTPYDEKSCDLLNNLGVEMIKIASTDTNNYQFIEYIAKKKKPVILSTAMANIKEVETSYKILKKYLKNNFAIMQCTGSYPAPPKEANLNVIKTYKKNFKCSIGYSDHVIEDHVALAATALGISCYEKHITVSKKLPGPDHRASMEKKEFKLLVSKIRKIEESLGSSQKKLSNCEKQNVRKLRKFLVARKYIKKGDKLNNSNMIFKRTGGKGISATEYFKIKGKRVKKDFKKNEIIKI